MNGFILDDEAHGRKVNFDKNYSGVTAQIAAGTVDQP
jgi:hypothetical protein